MIDDEQENEYINARTIANNPKADTIQNARTSIDNENEEQNKGFWNDVIDGGKEAPWAIGGGIADFGNETWKFLGLDDASQWINERLPEGVRELSDDLRGQPLDDTPLPVLAQPKSNTGKIIRGTAQFFTGFIPVLGQVNKLKWVQKGGKLRQSITKGTVAGAPVDFVGFNPNDPNAANWLGSKLDGNPKLQSLVLDYLGTNVDDPAIFNRFKNAFVGAAVGIVAEPAVTGIAKGGKALFNKLADSIREYKIERAKARGRKDLGITEEEVSNITSPDKADRLNVESDLDNSPEISATDSLEKQLNESAKNTALGRQKNKLSTPMEQAGKSAGKKEGFKELDFKGDTLHFGSGQDGLQTTKKGKPIPRNPDSDFLENVTEGQVVNYDPNFNSTKSRDALGKQNFKTVVSNFVLNVIAGSKNRTQAMVDMATSMADDGVGYISVRSDKDINAAKKDTWKEFTEGNPEDGYIVPNRGTENFQKGFTPEELETLAKEHFDNVEIIKTKDGKVATVKVSKPKRFDERVRPPVPKEELPKVFTDRGIQSPYLKVRGDQLNELTEALQKEDFRATLENTDINFDYIKTTDDVKAALETVSNLGGAIKEKVTFKDTEELAEFAGTSIKNINEMYLSTKGLGAKVLAARRVLVASAEHMLTLARKAEDSQLPVDALAVRRHVYIHTGIQKEISGIKGEIARALNAMKIEARGADARLAQVDALVSSFGGRDNLDKFVASINHLAKQEDAALRVSKFSQRGATARTMDAILEAYITGLLWNPKTQIVNALGSASASVLGVLERRYAEHINPTTGKFKFKRGEADGTNRIVTGEAHSMLLGLKAGYKEAFEMAMKAFRTDTPSDKYTKTDVYTPYEKSMSASKLELRGNIGAVADWLGNKLGLSTKLLMSTDEFFKTINYRMHLHSLAHRKASSLELKGKDYNDAVTEVINNPEVELHMESLDYARYNTFTEDLAKGSRSKVVQQWIETEYDHPGGVALKSAIKMYIPFFRTPVNLVRFSAERTPVMRWFSKRLKDDLKSNDPARVQMAKAKMATGNMIAINMMGLAELGLVTGAPPRDRELNANQRRVGWQPYSIVIPHQVNPFSDTDTYVPYNRLDPVGMSMGLMADYYQGSLMLANSITRGMDEDFHDLVVEDMTQAAGMITFAIVRNLEDKAYMQGISNMMGLLNLDPNRASERVTKDLINVIPPLSFASAAVRGVTRTVDPIRRVTDDADIFSEIRNVIYSKIPGFSEDLAPHRDLEGNVEYYPGNKTNVLMRGFNNLLNPASPSEITTSKVDQRVQELKVDLTDMRTVRTVTIGGARLTLNNEQIDYFSKTWGEYNKRIPIDRFNTGNKLADQEGLKKALLSNKNAAKLALRNKYRELDIQAQNLLQRQREDLVEQDSPLYEVFR
mgnify:CR=1 FL=1